MDEIRNDAKNKMQMLIDGKMSPADVVAWAELTYLAPGNQATIDSSESLSGLFDDLGLVDETHDGASPLYTRESFIQWLHQYENALSEEQQGKKIVRDI